MMEVQTESRSLVPLRGVPRILGGFHLDDHNVEEWSDSTNPALQHRAREETGKWINPERNADIHFQKREDSKKFEGGEEKERTEVIEGKSPDSNFQIIRTHREFQDGENKSGNSRTTSSSTSYQMSSSRGMRSTVKTTSNRTTSKTVSVSGGRTDDFETLKMSFQPLDNTTQRERINMSRSGTMGCRRPPTKMVRRHNPVTAMEETEETEAMDTSPPSEISRNNHNHNNTQESTGGLSILGYKNLSPKIRVGFPVEIQLELQTKLRVSSTASKAAEAAEEDAMGNNTSHLHQHTTRLSSSVANHNHSHSRTPTVSATTPGNLEEMEMDLEQKGRNGGSINSSNDSAIPFFTNNKISNNGHSTFDFSQQERRRSYGFESIAQSRYNHNNNNNYNGTKQIQSIGMQKESSPTPIRNSPSPQLNGLIPIPTSDDSIVHHQKPNPLTSLSRSWDLIQNVANSNRSNFQSGRTAEIDELSSSKGSLSKTVVRNNKKYDWDEGSVGGESDDELQREFTFDSLEDSSAKRKSSSVVHIESESPDMVRNEMDSPSLISPASERSRKLMKILDETPDLLNKMSFRNYFSGSPSQSYKSEPNPRNGWKNDVDHSEFEDIHEQRVGGSEMGDWERQKRQLNFLSDSLNRILDSSPQDNHSHAEKLNAQLTSEFSQNGHQLTSPEPQTNGTHSSESEGSKKQFGIDDGLLDNNELEEFRTNKKRASPRVSQTWIFSGDFDKPIQQVRDQDVTTSISATYDSFRKPFKKVEFCKTEVHFTADSGKFHIVETDENKPSTVHLYRRKRRSEKKALDLLKSLGIDGLDKSTSSGQSNEDNSKSSTDSGEISTQIWSEAKTTQSYSEKFSDASALLRPAEFPSKSERESNERSEGDEKINLVEKSNSNRLMMNLNLNLALDVGEIQDYDDDSRSPSHNILSKYGELKIQRYLKQLTSPYSLSQSETSETSMEPGDTGEKDSAQHRFDNNVLYENGSFVPMATRKSLIEMNNRKRSNQASHTSDQSSTASNYSLPNSDGNPTTSNENLKLTTMEATVRTAGPKPPQITSVQLRYSLDNDEIIVNRKETESESSYPPKPHMPDPIIVPQLTREANRNEETGKAFQRHIPFAVMPPEMSNPPYRNDPYYYSPSRSPSKSPTRHNAAFRNPKPPTPILPIQFSTFEKSGAALRERFYSKNPSCGCNNGAESDSAIPSHSLLGDDNALSSHRYSTPPRQISATGSSQSKSVVTINAENKYGEFSFIRNNDTAEINGRKRNASSDNTNHMQNNQQKDGDRSVTSTPEPVLSMDHTWKGPAHFENQVSPKGTSLTRSMTFPKSTRPEPEWVSKARSRESRVTDWNLVGKAYGSTRKSEPPWISELRIKNKTNSNEEIKSLPKISIVYPWQRQPDSYLNEKEELEHGRTVEPELKPVAPKSLRPFVLKKEKGKEILQQDKLTSWKSAHSELSNNKSIVDLNRDSDSILINPPQIEVKPLATKHKVMRSKHFSTGHSKVSPAPEEISQDSGNPTSMKGFNSVDESMGDSISSTRKPLQTSTINNKTNSTSNSNNNSTGKSKPPPKPPKPPQRTSSLVKCQTTGFSASLDKKAPTTRRVINHSNSEESPGSSRSNTPIHRHPTIKISKMPLKTAASPDGKLNPSKNKTKAHVSSSSESKRTGNAKPKDSPGETKSSIQNQNQSPSPSGGRATWSNSIKTQQARQGSPGAPSIKKLT